MITRRTFLITTAQAGGIIALGKMTRAAGLLPASRPEERARVAMVKTQDRAAGIVKALNLLNDNPFVGKHVVLKPNFNSAHAFPGSTHNDTLETLVKQLFEMGAWTITVADRSGMGVTRQVMQQKGIFKLARQLDFKTVVLDELPPNAYTFHESRDWHWKNGFYVPYLFHKADVVVQTCCLKTHQYGGRFTLSLKNSVGMVAKLLSRQKGAHDFMNELHRSPYQGEMIAEINKVYAPALILLDAMEAFVEGGPHVGKVEKPGVIVAGTDRVAVDAVGVALLRLHGAGLTIRKGGIFEQTQIRRAAELALGASSPEQIELVTEDDESETVAVRVRQELRAG